MYERNIEIIQGCEVPARFILDVIIYLKLVVRLTLSVLHSTRYV